MYIFTSVVVPHEFVSFHEIIATATLSVVYKNLNIFLIEFGLFLVTGMIVLFLVAHWSLERSVTSNPPFVNAFLMTVT